MAVCVISMVGRVGSVAGSNLVGILLDNYCEIAFISCGAYLVGTFIVKKPLLLSTNELNICFAFIFSLWIFSIFNSKHPSPKTS
jgi:hypothetical protein